MKKPSYREKLKTKEEMEEMISRLRPGFLYVGRWQEDLVFVLEVDVKELRTTVLVGKFLTSIFPFDVWFDKIGSSYQTIFLSEIGPMESNNARNDSLL